MAHAPDDLHVDVVTTAEHAVHLMPVVASRGGRTLVVRTTVGADSAPELREALAVLRPQLVQVNLVDPESMVAALEACAGVVPTVATLHMRGDVADLARVASAYRGLHHVVAVSQEFASVARSLGVPDDRLSHVVNGVDPLPVVTAPGGAVPVVGALGRLTRQKGFDVLLEAVRLLERRGTRLRVLIGGEGREEAALRRQADGLPVRFLRLPGRAAGAALPERRVLPAVARGGAAARARRGG